MAFFVCFPILITKRPCATRHGDDVYGGLIRGRMLKTTRSYLPSLALSLPPTLLLPRQAPYPLRPPFLCSVSAFSTFSLFLLLFAFLSPRLTTAAEPEFQGLVITIRSCDEVAIRHKAKIIAVRIAGIDCPARKQPFAAESKSFVGQLVNKHVLSVRPIGHDRQRRVWANVFLPDGRSLAYEMVKSGWAQVSASVVDERLVELEQDARRAKRGLWGDAQTVPSAKTRGTGH
ncbi:MAG TPA: thermonuclease family protein [Nitrospiraceae bacterium]|nr:thermonuclease family protein [Nitrospiraceae bacterium]